MNLTKEDFGTLAESELEKLPKYFRRRIENVTIVVEDFPSDDDIRRMKCDKYSLLGLYQGVPLTRRDTSYGMYPVSPDQIILFQKNIEAQCRTLEELKVRINEVLFHEIGHYFGMNEKQIREAMKKLGCNPY